MFKIGISSFGGGYAMLGVVTNEFVDRKHWISDEEMMDMIAISESLPGAIAINTSITVGYKIRGIKGSLAATLGVIFPCIVIITIVTYFYNSLPEDSVLWLFIKGIRAGVVGLMADVIIKLGRNYMSNAFSIVLFIGIFTLSLMTKIPVILLIISAGLIGYIYGRVKKNAAA